ncbi:hypothetical protein [Saccharothrix saharensis]|uniref:hypothetical protein n=1 Tax=Saccharothrix saharensis TaxID=571190 RepID=UPI0011532B50|nr:hypothetical protein [Saccharothrix saharensis]
MSLRRSRDVRGTSATDRIAKRAQTADTVAKTSVHKPAANNATRHSWYAVPNAHARLACSTTATRSNP